MWIEEELHRMSEAAQRGQPDTQLAHLETWQAVYEREKEARDEYAESADAAAEGA